MASWFLSVAVLVAPSGERQSGGDDSRREALTRFGLGVLRSRDDRPVEAVRQYEAAAKTDPAAAAPLRALVASYRELGRDAAALRTAESVLRLDPADADTAHTLGELYAEAKRPADAARVLTQAADSPRLRERPAKTLAILRDLAIVADPPQAEQALRRALTILSTHREQLLESGAFPSGAELDRTAGLIQEKLGRALEAQQKFAEAESAYRAAAQFYGDEATSRLNWNLSSVAAAQGNDAAAIAYLQKFLARKPDAPEPYERLAEYLTRAGRASAVIPVLTRMADQSPSIPAIRWVVAAETLRGHPTRGNALFRELAVGTTDPAFYRVLVKAYRTANRPADLLALIDEWYKASRVSADEEPAGPAKPTADPKAVARARALTTALRADPEACRQLVSILATEQEHTDDTWELLAALAEQLGRPDLAEQAARRGWESWLATTRRSRRGLPVETAPFHRLYELLTRQRKWSEAIDVCDQTALAAGGGFGYYRAIPLAELGNDVDALRIVDAFIASPNGDQYSGRIQKARVLIILGRYREAVEVCRSALKISPTPTESRRARYVLADALAGMKEYLAAEAELRAVLDEDPDDMLALNNLGYTLADQGRKLDEAEELIRRAIQLDTDARARAGHPEGASGVYLDSLGWVLFRRGRLAEARAALEAAVLLPDSGADPIVWDHLGDVAFRQADPTRARQAWSQAIMLYDNSHHGRQAGRQEDARRKLRLLP